MNSKQRARRKARRQRKRGAKSHSKLAYALDFDRVFSYWSLYNASCICMRGVKWKNSVLNFALRDPAGVYMLYEQLQNGKYKKGKPVHFKLAERGKMRDISAVAFRDRIVQRALCDNSLVPIIQNSLIYNNGASLKGKGTSFTRAQFKKHLLSARQRWDDPWVVLGDFKSYFASIDSKKAFEMISQKYYNLCFTNAERESAQKILDILELFVCDEPCLGLGNQTSQTAAIFFLNSFDQMAGQFGYYGRYMDDFYCICKTREQAQEMLQFASKSAKRMGIALNQKKCHILNLHNSKIAFLKRVYSFYDSGNLCMKMQNKALRYSRKHLKSVCKHFKKGKVGKDTMLAVANSTMSNAAQSITTSKGLKGYFCAIMKAQKIFPFWMNDKSVVVQLPPNLRQLIFNINPKFYDPKPNKPKPSNNKPNNPELNRPKLSNTELRNSKLNNPKPNISKSYNSKLNNLELNKK